MSWTTPRTWVSGEVETAAIFNAHVRDNFNAIGAAWTTDGRGASSIWQAVTTNPAIGNGTLTSRYINPGKLLIWKVRILAGSTTTYGTGTWQLIPPFTLLDAADSTMFGWYVDNSTGDNYQIDFQGTTTTALNGRALVATGATAAVKTSVINSSTPIAAAIGDAWTLQGVFELA